MTQARRIIGTIGEQAACHALEASGYRIVHRNYRLREGEIDIVCEGDGTLVFCEVKTRTSTAFGLPEEAVTSLKRRRIRLLAAEYLRREGRRSRRVRFDVISIFVVDGRVAQLRHIANAF